MKTKIRSIKIFMFSHKSIKRAHILSSVNLYEEINSESIHKLDAVNCSEKILQFWNLYQ